MEHVERQQAGVDGLGALDVGDRGERAPLARRVEVARPAGEQDVALALELEQPAERARDHAGGAVLPDRRGRLALDPAIAGRVGEGGEDPAAEAARAGARQVDVAALAARREVVRVVARERVVVTVEDREHGGHASMPRRGDAPQAKSGPGALRGKRAGALGAGTR